MKLHKIFLFLSLLLVIGNFGCQNKKSLTIKPSVSVSILPLKYIVDKLTDSTFDVNVMVPPGSSPEMYEPSPVQMKNITNSSVYFAVGPLEFENSILPKIKELNPTIRFVKLSDGINLLEGHKHHEIMGEEEHQICYDPHIWTSTSEFKQMVANTYNILSEIYPDLKSQLNKNFIKLEDDIDSLDQNIKEVVSKAKTKNFIIYHPALTYLAKEYNLNQIAIEEDGKNPSAQKMTNLVKLSKSEGIKYIFIQSQFDSHNAEIVAGELDGQILTIDPLGYDWLKNMNDLCNKLAIALKVNSEHE